MLMLARLSRRISLSITVVLSLAGVTGCTTNAVTGKSQLVMPIPQQIQIGAQNYAPSQQQQGGRYVVDTELGLYVNEVGQKLAVHSPLKLPYEFVVLNNDTPNAWALPGGKIAVNRGLLTLLDDEAQLAAVLGHEIIHAAAEHSANQMAKAQMLNVGVMAVGVAASRNENALLVGAGAALGAKAYQAHYGRSQELEADEYGIDIMIKAGYEPKAAVEIQQKFLELSKGQTINVIANLFASHPPSQERVDKNREKTAHLPPGQRNLQTYQRAIRQIKKDQTAYNTHTQALKAASEKNMADSLSLVNRAIKLQPNESLFYITKGQILSQQKDHAGAKKAYNTAAKKNPDYFMSHLGQAMSDLQLGNKSSAKTGFERSLQSLKTPIAAYYLGDIYLSEGNKDKAVPLLQYAAQSPDEIGKAAQSKLGKIQPQANTTQ